MQFFTVTADNASNNGTLLASLVEKIEAARAAAGRNSNFEEVEKLEELDPERAMIRCLAHIIHLAVMEILLAIKAISKKDAQAVGNWDEFEPMTEEEAERIGVPVESTNDIIVDEGGENGGQGENGDGEVDTSCFVAKVSIESSNVTVTLTSATSSSATKDLSTLSRNAAANRRLPECRPSCSQAKPVQ